MAERHTPLDFDPFEGDFGDQGDRCLSDAMVTARKAHACSHCRGPIAAGETYRSRSDIADGGLMRWKWCALCCTAMVEQMAALDDDERDEIHIPFDRRAAIATTKQEPRS
jgi:hypothetical protein